ncbi:Uncharacterized protein At3g49140 [Linum perenne]
MMMMAMIIEPAVASRFAAGSNLRSSATCNRGGASENIGRLSGNTRRQPRAASSDLPWKRSHISRASSVPKRSVVLKSSIRASAGQSSSDSSEQNGKVQCDSLEDAANSASESCGEAARLTAEETCRTIVEVNRKATLMVTDLSNEEIIWPDMPYVTDEYGNVYFNVKNDEDILQQLTSENNFVQAIIGFDTEDMIGEMELLDGIDDEDIDVEDDDGEEDDEYDEDVVTVLEDEDDNEDDDDDDEDDSVGDWTESETMDSHPMYFAKKLTQLASDDPVDWMKQPPTGLSMQGVLRPALVEEQASIQRYMSGGQKTETEPESSDNGSVQADDETSFYKLETTKIHLISADGHQALEGLIFSSHTTVEPDDYRKAKPDVIAHSAAKIMSRLKDGGENVVEALISLCWRCKGIRVEEAEVIGVDALGFDLRVCSGTQVQTLRFAFLSRATSEQSAESQLDELLFPRSREATSILQIISLRG